MLSKIATSIVTIWNDAYVQCSNVGNVLNRLESDIMKDIIYVRSLGSRPIKDEKILEWNKIFDLALCTCFLNKNIKNCFYKDCHCPDNKKLINFDTYIDQIFHPQKQFLISEEQQQNFEAILSGKF